MKVLKESFNTYQLSPLKSALFILVMAIIGLVFGVAVFLVVLVGVIFTLLIEGIADSDDEGD